MERFPSSQSLVILARYSQPIDWPHREWRAHGPWCTQLSLKSKRTHILRLGATQLNIWCEHVHSHSQLPPVTPKKKPCQAGSSRGTGTGIVGERGQRLYSLASPAGLIFASETLPRMWVNTLSFVMHYFFLLHPIASPLHILHLSHSCPVLSCRHSYSLRLSLASRVPCEGTSTVHFPSLPEIFDHQFNEFGIITLSRSRVQHNILQSTCFQFTFCFSFFGSPCFF